MSIMRMRMTYLMYSYIERHPWIVDKKLSFKKTTGIRKDVGISIEIGSSMVSKSIFLIQTA
jgi:hypothetical protein